MSKTITNADGITFTEPDLLAGLGVNWNAYRPSFDARDLNGVLLPEMSRVRAIAERELAKLRADEAKKRVARQTLENLKESAAALALCDSGIENAASEAHATIQGILDQACALAERGLYAPSATFRADEAEITRDIAFLDNLARFLESDAELDKLLYAFHTVDVKYRKKLFRECYRRLVTITELVRLTEQSKSVLKSEAQEVIRIHVSGCRVLYAKMLPMFRDMKKRLDRGDTACLEDDTIGLGINPREAEAFAERLINRELAQEQKK